MNKFLNVIRKIALLVCIAVFIYSSTKLCMIFMEYKKGSNAYDNAKQAVDVVVNKTDDSNHKNIVPVSATEKPKKEATPRAELKVDWSKFPDNVIGWIKMEDNKIVDYPVIQSQDNDYYLTHLYDGTYVKAGSIFVDYRNDGFNNRHVIVYGHNMKDGSMFSSVKKYRDQEYADKHRFIYVATPEGGTDCYYVYSCFITDANGDAYKLEYTDEEWREWLKWTQKESVISNNIEIPEDSQILTLSTCMSRGIETERCVINAVKVKNEISK